MEPGLAELIGGALRLDRDAFAAIAVSPSGLRYALIVLLLAGASQTLGQSVVLILNRVSRLRFFFALGLGGLELIAEALLWIASVWFLVGLFGADRPTLRVAARVIALAHAPLLFGFLVFLPYLGPIIARVLRGWVLLAAVVGISVAFGLPPLLAALAASAGFLARWLLLGLFGRVVAATNHRFGPTGGGGVAASELTLHSAEPHT